METEERPKYIFFFLLSGDEIYDVPISVMIVFPEHEFSRDVYSTGNIVGIPHVRSRTSWHEVVETTFKYDENGTPGLLVLVKPAIWRSLLGNSLVA